MKDFFSRFAQVTFVFLIVAGILALALSGGLGAISTGLSGSLIEMQTFVSVRFAAFVDFVTVPRDVLALQAENAALKDEVARLQVQVVDLQQQVAETEALAALVNFSRINPESSYTAASVIGRDPSPFLHYIIIDRGSADGIRRGMPVVTAQGLIGQVDAVIADAARVQLIVDPSSAVNVRLENAGREGILVGSVAGDLFLDFIPQDVVLEPGDVVLTSGLGGSYPQDLIIGQILTVRKRDSDIFQQATVQPIVDFSQLRVVLVITDFRPVDISPLFPQP